ncbi:hypothetical protein Tco_0687928 [Tanacetum coccineum]
MLAICAAYKPVVFKAPKTFSKSENVSQGTKLGTQTRHKKPLNFSKQPSVSSKEATKGGSSKPPVSTPVDTGMHKEDQQATGGLTSLGVTNKARVDPQLSSGMSAFNLNKPIYSASFIIHFESALGNDALAASTAEANPGNSSPSDFFTLTTCFKDLDSPEDDHVIVVTNSDEDEDDEVHATENVKTEDTSVPKSLSPSSSLPTELKDLPSKFNELTEEVKGLKNQVHNLEIKLPGELKEFPHKLEDFTKTVTSRTSQVTKLKTLQWELPAEFLVVPSLVEMV